MDSRKIDKTTITIELLERPATLAGRYRLSFHLTPNQAVSVHLTQGEMLDLWQKIGEHFNLLGMREV